MRKLAIVPLIALCSLAVAACGSATSSPSTTAPGASTSSVCSTSGMQQYLYKPGQLTVATDSPAYSPWFENNKPSNGKGYESAVAYAVAKQMGFASDKVVWTVEPFNNSYAPGPKKFDFDINEISYTPDRAKVVTFSKSYYDVNQALVALKASPIVAKHSPADLKTYVYGDQIGTTSLAFIESQLQPTQTPKVFNTLNDVKSALTTNEIQALVADTPTAQYISSSEIPHSTVVGQFPGDGEYYAMLFEKGDPLVACVDKALTTLKSNGTLASLQSKWLGIYTSIPTIKP